MKICKQNGIQWLIFELFSQNDNLIHGFSTRHSGCSRPPYDSLNLAFHVGDDPEAVIENRKRLCHALNFDLTDLTAGEQIHADTIRIVTDQDRGCGAFSYDNAFKGTDGFITNQTGVVLSSYYADCVPLFIFDPIQRVVALAHGGWKGTLKRIGAKTIRTMIQNFKTKPEDCLIGIGPSIGPCCYEVDEKVLAPLKIEFPYWRDLIESMDGQKWFLDLWETNRKTFLEIGVKPENIEVSGLCTSCHHDLFFSYRAENGQTGRMASIIALKN